MRYLQLHYIPIGWLLINLHRRTAILLLTVICHYLLVVIDKVGTAQHIHCTTTSLLFHKKVMS